MSDDGAAEPTPFDELVALEADLRDIVAETAADRAALASELDERWREWVRERFADTPHERTVARTPFAEAYPRTPGEKRALGHKLGFEPSLPDEFDAAVERIDGLAAVAAEGRRRLRTLHEQVLTEHEPARVGIEDPSVAETAGESHGVRATFTHRGRRVDLTATLGETPADDRVRGRIAPVEGDGSRVDYADLATEAAAPPAADGDFTVTGSLADGGVGFAVAGQLLATLPTVYALAALPETYRPRTGREPEQEGERAADEEDGE